MEWAADHARDPHAHRRIDGPGGARAAAGRGADD